ncbi:hypothetical protein SAMN05518848_112110 [Paenibacillus sp. PDC88]|nr:hypothetical protein SAMN05518848_112110 [Paenibacillus sp. PDC88]SFS89012.1 hypothetical protein SAMN04488601_106106 [Paenibacillus sp. 453mf]
MPPNIMLPSFFPSHLTTLFKVYILLDRLMLPVASQKLYIHDPSLQLHFVEIIVIKKHHQLIFMRYVESKNKKTILVDGFYFYILDTAACFIADCSSSSKSRRMMSSVKDWDPATQSCFLRRATTCLYAMIESKSDEDAGRRV